MRNGMSLHKKEEALAAAKKTFRLRWLVTALVLLLCMVLADRAAVSDARLSPASRTLSCDNPLEVARMSDGSTVINDSALRVLCIAPNGQLRYVINAGNNRQLTGITLDEADNLYLYRTVSNASGALRDEICKFDARGTETAVLYTIDYTEQTKSDTATVRTSPLYVRDGTLYFTRYHVYRTELLSLRLDTGKAEAYAALDSDVPFLYTDVQGIGDGVYYYAKETGELGKGTVGGAEEPLYKGSFDVRKNQGFRPFYIRWAGGNVYTYDYWHSRIYEVKDGRLGEPAWQSDFDYNTGVYEMAVQGNAVLGISDGTPWRAENGVVQALQSSARIPVWMAVQEGLVRLLKLCAVPAIWLCAAYILLWLCWNVLLCGKKIACKLLLLETFVCLGLLVLLYEGVSAQYRRYVLQNRETLGQKASLTAQLMDGSAVFAIQTSGDLQSADYRDLNRILIDNYSLYESEADTAALLLVQNGDGDFCILASNRGYGDSLGSTQLLNEVLKNRTGDLGTAVVGSNREICAYAPVTAQDGGTAGFLCLYTTVDNVQAQFLALWSPKVAVGCFLLLLVLFVAAALVTTRRLQRVAYGLQRISNGDFTYRIPERSTDELGTLIHCVNDLSQNIENLIAEKVALTVEVTRSQYEVLGALASIVENKSGQTGAHVARVSQCVRILAAQMGYEGRRLEYVTIASMLHDVGKLFVPAEILEKPGKLTPAEFAVIKRHVTDGEALLHNAPGPIMEFARNIALEHHEKWDGTGYCGGLQGEQIHLEARITAVADVFDALMSRRPYKDPFPKDKVYAIIVGDSGKQFDPAVVEVFVRHFDELCAVIEQNPDAQQNRSMT